MKDLFVLCTKNPDAIFKFVREFELENDEFWANLTQKKEAKRYASKKEAIADIKKAGFKISAFEIQPAL